MNSQTMMLTEQQETNRIAKGYEIYNQNLVEQISKDEYIVRGKYSVEILDDDVYICSCPDYTYRSNKIHSCCHIVSVQFYQLENGV